MIPAIENTPPEVAVALGFFIGISLRQGRLSAVLDALLPMTREEDDNNDTGRADGTDR